MKLYFPTGRERCCETLFKVIATSAKSPLLVRAIIGVLSHAAAWFCATAAGTQRSVCVTTITFSLRRYTSVKANLTKHQQRKKCACRMKFSFVSNGSVKLRQLSTSSYHDSNKVSDFCVLWFLLYHRISKLMKNMSESLCQVLVIR